MEILKIIVSICPVILFLLLLFYLDSFKLVKLKFVFISIIAGVAVCQLAYFINVSLIDKFNFDLKFYSIYISPFIEELLKAAILIIFIYTSRAAFMVDAAILGFAAGAGFSILENIYYINELTSINLMLWLIRGIGTGIMHGGTVAALGIITMNFMNRSDKIKITYFLPGYIFSVLIHSTYNRFLIPPLESAITLTFLIPIILILIFKFSENSLRNWMDLELDTEAKLLRSIRRGQFGETKSGKYFMTIKNRFSKEDIVDMLCFIQLYVELSIKAKGIIILRESGYQIKKDEKLREKLIELKTLRHNIGKTGILALKPILRFTNKDLWKLGMMEESENI